MCDSGGLRPRRPGSSTPGVATVDGLLSHLGRLTRQFGEMEQELTTTFEANRARLQAVAYRMLGSLTEAEDAVQETWIRLSRSDAESIDNLAGWLTTVLSRVCLGMLRSRRTRREEPLEPEERELGGPSPEEEAVLADTMGPALLLVLDTLSPSERLSFVLHDLFAVPFEDIAPIVGRSPVAARQLASRARRRVQGSEELHPGDRSRQQEIVEAFLSASRQGDFEAIVSLLDPDAVLRADRPAVEAAAANRDRGAPLLAPELRGAAAVAQALAGRATAAKLAAIEGLPGAVWAPGGRTRAVFAFHVVGNRITEIEIVTDPAVVAALRVEVL
jgi:RNA polymerase sigma-70 factor, ECF subfamily